MVEHGWAAPGQRRGLCCLCTPLAAQLRGVAAGAQHCKMKEHGSPQHVARSAPDLEWDTARVLCCVPLQVARRGTSRPDEIHAPSVGTFYETGPRSSEYRTLEPRPSERLLAVASKEHFLHVVCVRAYAVTRVVDGEAKRKNEEP